jgi:hypothetical protein
LYTILVTDDNELVVTKKEKIMQKSSNINGLRFLVNQFYNNSTYGELDMTKFTATLQYVLPVSKTYRVVILTQSAELFNDEYVEFKIPTTVTDFTSEAGDVEIMLTFSYLAPADEMEEITGEDSDRTISFLRKTDKINVHVSPVTDWSQYVTEDSLTALDKKIAELTALANQVNQDVIIENTTRVVGLKIEGTKVWLIDSEGNQVGEAIDTNHDAEMIVVDL